MKIAKKIMEIQNQRMIEKNNNRFNTNSYVAVKKNTWQFVLNDMKTIKACVWISVYVMEMKSVGCKILSLLFSLEICKHCMYVRCSL